MNEKLIQDMLFDFAWEKNFLILAPNVTPNRWCECDMLGVTKSHHMVEFEIKISRSDFFHDSKKTIRGTGRPAKTKHELLGSKVDRGPRRFYFVTPVGLIKREELPAFAGLIECDPTRRLPTVVVDAPIRSVKKLSDADVIDCCRALYWRYWFLRKKQKWTPVDESDFVTPEQHALLDCMSEDLVVRLVALGQKYPDPKWMTELIPTLGATPIDLIKRGDLHLIESL